MGRKSYYLKLVLAIIALLTALPLSLNLYIEFTTPCPYDVGRNVYSVKHILAGAKIGVDEESRMLVGELMLHTLGVLLYSKGDIGPKIVPKHMLLYAVNHLSGRCINNCKTRFLIKVQIFM